MKVSSLSFDAVGPVFLAGCIMLMRGKIPFTARGVGGLFLLSKLSLKFTWER